jgi:hypothetical protein
MKTRIQRLLAPILLLSLQLFDARGDSDAVTFLPFPLLSLQGLGHTYGGVGWSFVPRINLLVTWVGYKNDYTSTRDQHPGYYGFHRSAGGELVAEVLPRAGHDELSGVNDPHGPAAEVSLGHAVRGGDWEYDASFCRPRAVSPASTRTLRSASLVSGLCWPQVSPERERSEFTTRHQHWRENTIGRVHPESG